MKPLPPPSGIPEYLGPAPVFDLSARRAARPTDSRVVIDNLADGAESLLTQFRSWPFVYLREAHIIGAERSLVALQGLLIDMRAFVPSTDEKP